MDLCIGLVVGPEGEDAHSALGRCSISLESRLRCREDRESPL
jgi:hypothetical protein